MSDLIAIACADRDAVEMVRYRLAELTTQHPIELEDSVVRRETNGKVKLRQTHHSYAEFTSGRLRDSQPFTLAGLLRAMEAELSIMVGAACPMTVLVALWAAGARLGTAVSAAIWASAVTIVVIELVAGLRADQSGRKLALQVMFGALLGLLIISLKLVLK